MGVQGDQQVVAPAELGPEADPAAGHVGPLAEADPAAAAQVPVAGREPLGGGTVAAVATEPPYDRGAGPLAEAALAEAARLLRPGGATAWLCAAWQAPGLRATAGRLGLRATLDTPVDRKGLAVVALVWRKPG